MQPITNDIKWKLAAAAAVLLVLFLVVKCLNTPHWDSTEKPLPSNQEKALQAERDKALKRADSLLVVADTAVAHSLEAYDLGVKAGKQAATLRLETHSIPKPHAQTPPTPASTKQLQQYFNDY